MLTGTSAVAQSPAALAEALFQEGKRLMTEGQYASACPKLAESQRLDPGTGTLLLLASCREHEGKLAAAWSDFVEAQAQAAHARRKDRVAVAADGVKRLLPRLSRLTVSVRPDARVPGLLVKVDGAVLSEAAWGVSTHVDPGEHVVEAIAPGRLPFRQTLSAAAAETKVVEVGPLEVPAAPSPAPPAPAAASSRSSSPVGAVEPGQAIPGQRTEPPSRVPSYVVGGLGAASVLVGLAYFGAKARSDNRAANSLCPDTACASEEGLAKGDSAASAARMANVFVGIGLVGVGAGSFLWFRAGSAGAKVGVSPTVGGGHTGLSARVTFQ